jgi:hypothetical protein
MIPVLFSKADIIVAAVPLSRYPDNRCLRGGSTSASLTCPSNKNGVLDAFDPRKEMHGGLEEISLSFYDARSMTLSQISATCSYNGPHRSTRTVGGLSSKNRIKLYDFNGRNCDG